MMRFVKYRHPVAEGYDAVEVHLDHRHDQYPLAAEYERTMKTMTGQQRADICLMLELVKGVLDQTFYKHPEEHELPPQPPRPFVGNTFP